MYRLHVAKPDFGFKLDELPFAHPRQVVESLPVLRQWGCFGALVQDIFSPSATSSAPSFASNGALNGRNEAEKSSAASLDDFLANQDKTNSNDDKNTPSPLSIDISLATSPLPTLSLAFPSIDGEGEISLKVSVELNGEVVVGGRFGRESESESVVVEGKRARRWARALTVCGVVGVWVEWVRGEVGVLA